MSQSALSQVNEHHITTMDTIFDEYTTEHQTSEQHPTSWTCTHAQITYTNGKYTCCMCDHEMDNVTMNSSKDLFLQNTMCYSQRKQSHQCIFDDIIRSNDVFNTQTLEKANELYMRMYQQNASKKVFRGSMRKSIAYAALYYALNTSSAPSSQKKSFDELCTLLSISTKQARKGMRYFTYLIPEDIKHILYVDDQSCIMNTLFGELKTTEDEQDLVRELYEYISTRSNICSRSRPRSVLVGLLYFVRIQHPTFIQNKQSFVRISKISELTIIKVYRSIQHILYQNPTMRNRFIFQINDV